MPPKRLLVISNGHGEDSIAAAIVRRLPSSIAVDAYPTLGDGAAYAGVCPLVGPRAKLPSEGSRVARGSVWRDLASGMLGGVPAGLGFLRRSRAAYDQTLIVGDIVGVAGCLFAGIRGAVYVDVYKTGYGGLYRGLERAVIGRTCRAAFCRRLELAEQLSAAGVDARAAGNVMLDTIPRAGLDARALRTRPLGLALLPGSRAESVGFFGMQVAALRGLPDALRPDVFLALAASLDPQELARAANLEWTGERFTGDVTIHAARGALGDVLDASDLVLSQAGTATVQAIGMGRPVISVSRPKDRPKRIRDESRLFGEARLLVADADALGGALRALLADPAEIARRGAIGRARVGPPGALDAIVAELTR